MMPHGHRQFCASIFRGASLSLGHAIMAHDHGDFVLLLVMLLLGAIAFIVLIAYKQQDWLEERSHSDELRDERRQKMA